MNSLRIGQELSLINSRTGEQNMKSMIIIGAGITGLTSGIYAKKSGFDVQIYESHYLPGGMCTGWNRKGYYFEGCFHYIKLLGVSKTSLFHDVWKELGLFNDVKLINQEYLQVFRDESGESLYVYTDPDKLQEAMLSISKEDEKQIKVLCQTIKRCYWFTHRTGINPFQWLWKIINILSAMPFLFKYGKLNLKEYGMTFKHPLIRQTITKMFDYEEVSCIQLPMFLGLYYKENVNFPEGGSLRLMKGIEKSFVSLGGNISYKTPVKRIVIENNQAIGVELEDGSIKKADIILSAADGYKTLFHLLGNQFTTQKHKDLYDHQPIYTSFIQVSFGMKKKMEDIPYVLRVNTKNAFHIAGEMKTDLCLVHYDFDKTLAPPDCSTLIVLYTTNFKWWENIEYQSEAYRLEKEKILKTTIEQLELILPEVASQIEVTDVSTPYTTVRYTHNYKSGLGFIPTVDYMKALRNPQFQLDGLSHFYLAGQWVSGMGVPNAALSGKNVIKEICKTHQK